MNPPTDKSISICFVAPKAYGLFDPSARTNFGGAEVDLYMLATELAKDPVFAVSFITADYGQPADQTRENVRLLKSLKFGRSPLDGAVRIWRVLKRAGARFYLLKTASPGVPLVYMFCRLHGRKFLYRTAARRECDGTYRREHPILGRLFYRALRGAACVFAQNRDDQELLSSTAGISALVIANGHRIGLLQDRNREHVLWVGRSAAIKHPQRFLELARRFPQEQFVMICRPATGDTGYESLKKQAEGIANLKFYPNVDFSEMDSYFASARVFVNTSDKEGFPNTFIQAAKAGTPILSWQVNPDQFLARYQCGLSCGGRMEKLCEGLKFLLEGGRYIEIGQNGLKYCLEHHDISKIVNVYKEHLYRLAGRRPGEPG